MGNEYTNVCKSLQRGVSKRLFSHGRAKRYYVDFNYKWTRSVRSPVIYASRNSANSLPQQNFSRIIMFIGFQVLIFTPSKANTKWWLYTAALPLGSKYCFILKNEAETNNGECCNLYFFGFFFHFNHLPAWQRSHRLISKASNLLCLFFVRVSFTMCSF